MPSAKTLRAKRRGYYVKNIDKIKEKQPRVPTQRLVIAMSQRKRRQPRALIQRHDTALKHRKRTLAHVHITHQRKKRYVPSEGINMHCLNPSLL